jgi:hypothetical protein
MDYNPENVHQMLHMLPIGLQLKGTTQKLWKPSERSFKTKSTTNGNMLAMDVSDIIMINFDKW